MSEPKNTWSLASHQMSSTDEVAEAVGLGEAAPQHIPGRREQRLITAGLPPLGQDHKVALGEGAPACDARAASYRPLSYETTSPREIQRLVYNELN